MSCVIKREIILEKIGMTNSENNDHFKCIVHKIKSVPQTEICGTDLCVLYVRYDITLQVWQEFLLLLQESLQLVLRLQLVPLPLVQTCVNGVYESS